MPSGILAQRRGALPSPRPADPNRSISPIRFFTVAGGWRGGEDGGFRAAAEGAAAGIRRGGSIGPGLADLAGTATAAGSAQTGRRTTVIAACRRRTPQIGRAHV